MTKPEFFEHIDTIEMRLRSAEQLIQSGSDTEYLLLNLSLITIARGSCSMLVKPNKEDTDLIGQLLIPSDRNIIEATVELSLRHFNQFVTQIIQTADRAVTAKMMLSKTLVLDNNGCLIINNSTNASITKLSWTFTLK